jgi:hypothetical protein
MKTHPLTRVALAIAVGLITLTGTVAAISADGQGASHKPVAASAVDLSLAQPAGQPAVADLPLTKPVAAAKPTRHAVTVAPRATKRVVAHTARRTSPITKHTAIKQAPAKFVAGPTSWSALNAAIARIKSYRAGDAQWIVENTGWWGTADWYKATIYISPSAPESKLYDIAVHEWSHLLSIRPYGGDVHAAAVAMRAYFGGTSGPEYAADCMAKLQGATYLKYTQCTTPTWVAGARLLLAGKRL